MASNIICKRTGSWNKNEREIRSWASLLSGAEQNIASSCQQLEKTFKTIDHDSQQIDSSSHIPDPINIIRRLAALEMSLGQLKQDCEAIFSKRRSVVQFVIEDQNKILEHTEKVCIISDRTIFLRSLGLSVFSNCTNDFRFLCNTRQVLPFVKTRSS